MRTGSNFTGADQSEPGFTYEDAFQLFYRHVGLSEEDRAWVMGVRSLHPTTRTLTPIHRALMNVDTVWLRG